MTVATGLQHPVLPRSIHHSELPDLAAIQAFLHLGSRFLVTSHARPDGDAVGSMLATASLLEQLGKSVDLVLADPAPQIYQTLPDVQRIRQTRTIDASHYDAVIILECDSTHRTGIQGFNGLPILNIDHHITGIDYGIVNWIDWEACAVAVQVYRLVLALGLRVTPAMATCLYTAMFTDTGAFTYPGTASTVFPLANDLMALGADADAIAHDVLYSVSAARIHLLGLALSRIQLRGRVAWCYITQEDLATLGATDEDSESTITYLISIAGVEAALFLRELPSTQERQQCFRVSLRSKSSLDVSAIAAACGGGGHRSAAGCVMPGPLHGIVVHLLTEIEREMATSSPQ